MKFPQKTIKRIARYLPEVPTAFREDAQYDFKPGKEYTIDELARVAETTVRNIRAYQDKGLLPPPEIRGRKGIYSTLHLSRLRVIAGLLERGYTLSSIGELLTAMENGIDLRHLLGLESALTSPWTDEEPQLVSMTTLTDMYEDKLTPEVIAKAVQLDLLRPEKDGKVRVRSMRMMRAGAELVAMGIPMMDLLEIVTMLRGNVERVANELVKLVSDHVLSQYGDRDLPPKKEFPKLAELIWRLRPLAEMAVHAELARAMDKAASHFLSDRLEQILSRIEQNQDPGVD